MSRGNPLELDPICYVKGEYMCHHRLCYQGHDNICATIGACTVLGLECDTVTVSDYFKS